MFTPWNLLSYIPWISYIHGISSCIYGISSYLYGISSKDTRFYVVIIESL